MGRSKIAVFIDVENLTCWLKDKGPEKLITELSSTGQLIVRKAYGNWNTPNIQGFQSDLNNQGFELIHNYHPVAGKNSSDIQLTVDVMETALRLANIEWFVLATGDSDFSPLFRRLREMGKEVIGVGPRSPLSRSVKTSCTRYIYTDSVEQIDDDTRSKELCKAIELTTKVLKTFDGAANCAALKNRIIALDSAFSEQPLGFSSFTEFLASIDHIALSQTTKNNIWQAKLISTKACDTNNHSLRNTYLSYLKKNQWPLLPEKPLRDFIALAKLLDPLQKQDISTRITNDSLGKVSLSDAKRAQKILFKSRLFDTYTRQNDAGTLAEYAVKQGVNHFEIIDIALLSRVINACKANSTDIDSKVMSTLLYGTYSKTKLDQLMTEAEISALLHNT